MMSIFEGPVVVRKRPRRRGDAEYRRRRIRMMLRASDSPHLRVRLCWGGDTLRVVQRDNLPSPVVPGTTYRNVYIAVELIGRLNAECLANVIGVGPARQVGQPTNVPAAAAGRASSSAGSCAFLGGSAGTGANPRPPTTPLRSRGCWHSFAAPTPCARTGRLTVNPTSHLAVSPACAAVRR